MSSKQKEGTTKYDRAAEKNLQTFTAMVGLDGASGEEDDEGEEYTSQSGSGEAEQSSDDDGEDASPPPQKKGKSTAKKSRASTSSTTSKKRKSKGGSNEFKSSEFIDESDDSSHEVEPSRPVEEAPRKRKKSLDSAGGGEKGKGKAEAKPKKEKAVKEKKAPARKEGDADKGSEHEEDRITKLKALLVAAEWPRPFNQSTGAERTLTAEVRIARLEQLLNDVGLKVVKGGALPSMSKAKEIGARRALEKEMQEISGAPKFDSLRGGKKRVSLGGDSDEDEGGAGPAKKKAAKPFGAFLKGLDGSSDSD